MRANKIYQGDCLEVLKTFPDNSIDCCVTSPPYWGLRAYPGTEKLWPDGWYGQLGLEPSFNLYIHHLTLIFKEVHRVLKPPGTCFVNLNDTYGGSGAGTTTNADTSKYIENSKQSYVLPNGTAQSALLRKGNLNKSLLMIPERFAISMIDEGFVLRNKIIWYKRNQMPSSAKDRFTVDYEPIYFFTKQSKGYYFEQQLEPYTKPLDRWAGDNLQANGKSDWSEGTGQKAYRNRNMRPNADGKNMRCVWDIPTKPSTEKHYASWPQKLVERMISAGCPEDGIVLEPFAGSGTTCVVAQKIKRQFIGIELSGEYKKISHLKSYKELGMFNKAV